MKHILHLAGAVMILFSASAALAQTGSDISGPTGSTTVTFAPLPVPTSAGGPGGARAGPAPAAMGTVTSTAAMFAGGAPQTSPVTGQAIPQNAVQTVGSLIQGGSPASVTSVSQSLQAAGAPPGATAQLTQALAALAGATPGNAFNLIVSAAQAFNAFVQSAPASFFAAGNLPPQFLAIHAALTPMVNAIR
jgi:hypothetical protein